MSKWLEFKEELETKTRRTKIINVISKSHGDLLGEIRWFGRWRQYAFYPQPETVFTPECMQDITGVIQNLMADWRLSRYEKMPNRQKETA